MSDNAVPSPTPSPEAPKREPGWALSNFKSWGTTIVGLALIVIAGVAPFLNKEIEWLWSIIFGAFGFALLGLPTPDFIMAIFHKKS